MPHGEVENPEAKRTEDDRCLTVGGKGGAVEYPGQACADEIAVAAPLFGKMDRSLSAANMVSIVDNVVGANDDFWSQVSQRDVQDDASCRSPLHCSDMGSGGCGRQRGERT